MILNRNISTRTFFILLTLIFLFGLGVRGLCLAWKSYLTSDEVSYLVNAEIWNENKQIFFEKQQQPFLYTQLIGCMMNLGIRGIWGGICISFVSGAVFILLCAWGGWCLFEKYSYALLAALFAACSPFAIRYSVLGLRDQFFATLFAGALIAAFYGTKKNKIPAWFFFGFLTCLSALTRIEGWELIIIFTFYQLVIFYHERTSKCLKKIIFVLIWFCIGALTALVPLLLLLRPPIEYWENYFSKIGL